MKTAYRVDQSGHEAEQAQQHVDQQVDPASGSQRHGQRLKGGINSEEIGKTFKLTGNTKQRTRKRMETHMLRTSSLDVA